MIGSFYRDLQLCIHTAAILGSCMNDKNLRIPWESRPNWIMLILESYESWFGRRMILSRYKNDTSRLVFHGIILIMKVVFHWRVRRWYRRTFGHGSLTLPCPGFLCGAKTQLVFDGRAVWVVTEFWGMDDFKFLGLKPGFRLRAGKGFSGKPLATPSLRGRCFPLEPLQCPVHPWTGKVNGQWSLPPASIAGVFHRMVPGRRRCFHPVSNAAQPPSLAAGKMQNVRISWEPRPNWIMLILESY